MIEIKDLTIANKEKIVLNNINLSVRSGERIGIIGPSGVGKSTLTFAILGEIAEGLNVKKGSVLFEGKNLLEKKSDTLKKLRHMTGHLDQDPDSILNPKQRISFILRELTELKGEDYNKQLTETLSFFRLPSSKDFLNRYPWELSGDQRRRVALARILLRNPKLIILDEPTTDLDCDTKEDVILLLSSLIEKINPSLVVISHDFSVIKSLCNKCFVLNNGNLSDFKEDKKEHKNFSFKKQPLIPLKKKLLLEVKNLTGKAPNLKSATIKNLSFSLYENEALAITGASGSGKTTLIRTILGLWAKTFGNIEINNQALAPSYKNRSMEQLKIIAWVPQDPRTSFNPALTLGKSLSRITKPLISIPDALKSVGFSNDKILKYFPNQLSGGQIQRLAIMRALLEGGKLFLLDEITSSLDSKSRDEICELLCQLKKDHSLLLVTHDPYVVKTVCDRNICLDGYNKGNKPQCFSQQ